MGLDATFVTSFGQGTQSFKPRQSQLKRRQWGAKSVCCVAAAEKGTVDNKYKIAILEGDGAGPKVAAMTQQVLEGLDQYTDIHFEFERVPFGKEAHEQTGSVLPKESADVCRKADGVLRGPQGFKRGGKESILGHSNLRDEFELFAQLRPVTVYPQLAGASSFRKNHVLGVDMMIVREVSGGALAADEVASTDNKDVGETRVAYTQDQVNRISDVALQIAEARNGNVVNVDKAYAIRVSAYWRKLMHKYFEQKIEGRSDILLSDMFVDDFCREVILNPKQFDVVVTSNLFGDFISEVAAGLSGRMRISPSTWISASGLHICGPADIYNSSAYPDGTQKVVVNPIAMIRSASMLLRYGLNEPGPADIIQQALMQTLEEYVTPDLPALQNQKVVDAETFTQYVISSLEYMHQFEMVCNPSICGE